MRVWVWTEVIMIAAALATLLVLAVPAAHADGAADHSVGQQRGEPAPYREADPVVRGGEVLPVLPLGAGLACLGAGLGVLALRLRRI
ncbi:hypothetical protein H7827_14275 [Streptomyces sp. JH002]|uniref:hypothetical protein n=1 Tax=Streptomyces sp. JH002 TaxID=2763259 RepID=UPI003D8048ED